MTAQGGTGEEIVVYPDGSMHVVAHKAPCRRDENGERHTFSCRYGYQPCGIEGGQ